MIWRWTDRCSTTTSSRAVSVDSSGRCSNRSRATPGTDLGTGRIMRRNSFAIENPSRHITTTDWDNRTIRWNVHQELDSRVAQDNRSKCGRSDLWRVRNLTPPTSNKIDLVPRRTVGQTAEEVLHNWRVQNGDYNGRPAAIDSIADNQRTATAWISRLQIQLKPLLSLCNRQVFTLAAN